MSRRKIKAGSVSTTIPIFIQDTSSAIGAGLASLVYNTSGLAARYRREGASAWTTITLATATLGTFTSGGFITSGGVSGKYEVGIPDAALAAGAKWVEIEYYGATNMLPVLLEIELDAVDYQDANTFGLTGFNNTRLSDQGRTEAASGVWNANPSDYSGVNTFGRELQPIYYADIKQYYDFTNTRDEYSVNWFRGNAGLGSGVVTNSRISVYNTSNGTPVFENASLDYVGVLVGTLRYNDGVNMLTAGEPYNAVVSGTIDGVTRVWQKVIGRNKLN